MERIQSPQSIEIEYAGFWIRFAAYIIDSLVIRTIALIIAIPIFLIVAFTAIGMENITDPMELLEENNLLKISVIVGSFTVLFLFDLVARWLYYALFESSKNGGTLGKIAVGIKVTNLNGNRISFAQATGRYFARIISNMTLLVGYIMAGFTLKKQALHDMISNCLVVKKSL
ncbi:MAG: RDD family protein [Bacteroidales bacterium]